MTGKSDIDGFETDELLALARLAIESNDFEGALRKLKKVVNTENAPAEGLALAARVYAQLKLFDRAEKLYQRFLEKHPDATLERFQLGMTRFEGGKASQALEVWDVVLKEQPNYPPALFYKGLVLTQLGKINEAKHVLDGLLKSASADNLYFTRAKELLQAIEIGRVPDASAARGGNGGAKLGVPRIPPDPYQTEH
jgi:tetratricopeptide (TPR) repeat protein